MKWRTAEQGAETAGWMLLWSCGSARCHHRGHLGSEAHKIPLCYFFQPLASLQSHVSKFDLKQGGRIQNQEVRIRLVAALGRRHYYCVLELGDYCVLLF